MAAYLLQLPQLTVNGAVMRYTSLTTERGIIWAECMNGTPAASQAAYRFTIQDGNRAALVVYAYERDVTWEPVPSIPATITIIGGDLGLGYRFRR